MACARCSHRHASDLKHCRAHQVNIYFIGPPAIEETLIMMPPSFPCSLLMCSSAKYVPLITDVYTEKNGQSSCADKDRKHLLFTCMCIHTHVIFIYLHVYDMYIVYINRVICFYYCYGPSSLSYQVDINGLAPVLLIVDAGIVDNDVQMTKGVHCRLEGI